MLIDNIIKKLELNSHKSYYTFETFILNLLKVHLESENKPFESQTRRLWFDAYAAEGINEIKGPTQIEIKFHLERYPIHRLVKQIYSIQARKEIEKFDNLLIITPLPISNRVKERIISRSENYKINFQIYF